MMFVKPSNLVTCYDFIRKVSSPSGKLMLGNVRLSSLGPAFLDVVVQPRL